MTRDIITIDEKKCTGCGLCVTGCPEGALQMIDGKARLVGDLYCDGLGACIGDCPEGAITVERREAEPYDENKVMDNVVTQGEGVIRAHLTHLKEHGEMGYYTQALDYLSAHGYDAEKYRSEPAVQGASQGHGAAHGHVHVHGGTGHAHGAHAAHGESSSGGCGGGCPGSLSKIFEAAAGESGDNGGNGGGSAGKAAAPSAVQTQAGPDTGQPSQLTHWPVQMHLMNPSSAQYAGADFLLASDCSAFSAGDFHSRFLKGRKLGIACPKLDVRKESYEEKLIALIDEAKINTLTVVVMEVPCCSGLLMLAKNAADKASRKVPIKKIVVSVEGEVLSEEWM